MVLQSSSNSLPEDIEVMASSGDWNMVTWKSDGVPVKHEFFFINAIKNEQELPDLKQRIEQINSRQTLGKGFRLVYSADPEICCHVFVKPGWQFGSSVQSRLFLEQFLKLIN